MPTGKFIVFEGLDGSGKTTQARRLAERMSNDGHAVHLTFEPTNGPIGAVLRHHFTGRLGLDSRVLPYLYAADRADHLYNEINGICVALSREVTVICDRYVLSSFAYQVPEQPFELVDYLNRGFPRPDLTLFLSTSPSSGLSAKQKQSSFSDANDSMEKQSNVAIQYERAIRAFGREHNVTTIKVVEGDIAGVGDDIYVHVKELFKDKRAHSP